MSNLYKLANRISGEVPGVDLDLVMWKMTEALIKIYDEVDWAFQRSITYANWLCPGLLGIGAEGFGQGGFGQGQFGGSTVAGVGQSPGSTTVIPYSPIVTLDVSATMAILNLSGPPLLTTLQYRDPAYSIYNIIAQGTADTVAFVAVNTPGFGQTPGQYIVNGVGGGGSGAAILVTVNSDGEVEAFPTMFNGGSGYVTPPTFTLAAGGTPATFTAFLNITLTLDRPWLEPTVGGGQPYMIYQAYFVAPVKDFHKFIEVRDTTNSAPLDFWTMTQAELAIRDPQRTEFANPSYVVPAGFDYRVGSSTYGYPMFELYPQQLNYLPYSFSYRRKGIPPFEAGVPITFQDFQTYQLPQPITEQLLGFETKVCLYEYKEAQKDKEHARGAGANWLLLMAAAGKRYEEILDKLIAIDLNLNGEAFTRLPGRETPFRNNPYSNQLGGLNVGGYPESDW